MPATRRVIEEHVRRLDRSARQALVADLWRARGFAVTREGACLVARSDGTCQRLYVGAVAGAPETADVVVDADSVLSHATTTSVIDAADLAERLVYAVDPARRRRLCDRHLGAPPTELEPPLRQRLRRRLRRQARPIRTAAPAVLALATLLLLAATLATAPATEGPAQPAEGTELEAGNRFPGGIGQNATVPPPSYPSSPPTELRNGSVEPAPPLRPRKPTNPRAPPR